MDKKKADYFLFFCTKYLQKLTQDFYDSFGFETFAVVSGQVYLTLDGGKDIGFNVNERAHKTKDNQLHYSSSSVHLNPEDLFHSESEDYLKLCEGYTSVEETPKDDLEIKGTEPRKKDEQKGVDSHGLTQLKDKDLQQILEKSNEDLKRSSQSRPKRKYKPKVYNHTHDCLLCGRRFQTVPRIATHIKSHIAERPFTCETCGKNFPTIMRLKSHRAMHIEDKPYSCDMCNYSCKQPQTLVLHKRTHTGEKPFICHICGTSFSQLSSLTYHKTTHLEKREYLCDICQKGFRNVRNLKRHKRLHSDQKNFKCEVCGRLFLLKRYLQKHSRHHSPDKLQTHSQTHSSEKRFVCDICGDTFSNRDYLISHQNRHTAENPLRGDNFMLMMSIPDVYQNQRYNVYDQSSVLLLNINWRLLFMLKAPFF